MNILSMSEMLTMAEGSGGLFDFNATLPLVAIQFIILTALLTFLFYSPTFYWIDMRDTLITKDLERAKEQFEKVQEWYDLYARCIKIAQKAGKARIAQSENDAKGVAALILIATRLDLALLLERTNRELEKQRDFTTSVLELQENELSQRIRKRVLSL